ncbi:MAG TPA: hypothetical protein VGO40_21755 [Longimicrobium sp.]|jgi:hypothetical protein|nr:hypothetical protein [Longimicrobium sp.]
MKIVPRAALLLAAALLAACDAGAPAKPLPGDLTVSLATPNVDGALVVAITGPDAVGAVQSAAPGTVVRVRTQGTTTTVAVFGVLAAGPLLRLTVPDVRQASRYAATVREAADDQNAPRASLAGYVLAVSR